MCKQNNDKSRTNPREFCFASIKSTFLLFLFLIQVGCGGGAGAGTPLGTISSDTATSPTVLNSISPDAAITVSVASGLNPAASFKVSGPDGVVSGSVSYDQSGNTVTFVPDAPLLPEATYIATLTTAAKEVSGQPSSSQKVWQLTTGKDVLARAKTVAIPKSLFNLHVINLNWGASWPSVSFNSWRNFNSAWYKLEPKKGEWNFQMLDSDINLAAQKGVDPLLVLSDTALWAAARPADGNRSEPADLNDWANYVRKVATRYKGTVHYYELWNEPNGYTGTIETLVQMSRLAYQILKEIDPTVTVVSPAIAANANYLERYLAAGGGAFADVIGYHFYVAPKAPEAMVERIQAVRAIMSKYQIDKPLWNTETGWKIQNSDKNIDDEMWAGAAISDADATSYIVRSFVLAWAAGVDRFYWYAWGHRSMGFTEYDAQTPKPCAKSFDEVQRWLVSRSLVSCSKNNLGTWVVRTSLAGKQSGWIIWNPDRSVQMAIPKEWSAKTLRYADGNGAAVSDSGVISVGSMPILVEN